MNSGFWRGRRVLVTGHTGIKGAWLSLWLDHLGANVQGFALDPPTSPSLHDMANLARGLNADVRDLPALVAAFQSFEPEIVFHLAAQSLVRVAYRSPIETFQTNIIGTANLLESIRTTPSVSAVVVVTSDKCYAERNGGGGPFVETDAMGGADPYSASKGCAEIVTHAYERSFFASKGGPALATARAGNIIAGGDFSEDRLVPDIARALVSARPINIRYPGAVRPWQHVLDPLAGYMILAERLVNDPTTGRGAWNFGPPANQACSVAALIAKVQGLTGGFPEMASDTAPAPPETSWLRLDASKARHTLGWHSRLDLTQTLRWSLEWYAAARADWKAAKPLCLAQIERYSQLPALDQE